MLSMFGGDEEKGFGGKVSVVEKLQHYTNGFFFCTYRFCQSSVNGIIILFIISTHHSTKPLEAIMQGKA